VDESAEPFELAVSRAPRFIVLSEFWAIRHLTDEKEFGDSGRISSAEQKAHFRETAVRKYFRDLRDEKLPYRIRYEAGPSSKFWPPVRVHRSINEKFSFSNGSLTTERTGLRQFRKLGCGICIRSSVEPECADRGDRAEPLNDFACERLLAI
jgi:hypothetical protein